MCNCINEHELRILEHLKKEHPDKNFIEELNSWLGTGFSDTSILFNGNGQRFLRHDFVVKYTFLKKNHQPSTAKKMTINIFPNYCCFCGEKLNIEN